MCGAIVSPQNVPGVEGLLTVSTGIFLHQLLQKKKKKKNECHQKLLPPWSERVKGLTEQPRSGVSRS